MNNLNACIYFYHKGLIKYVGVMLKGKMERLGFELDGEKDFHYVMKKPGK